MQINRFSVSYDFDEDAFMHAGGVPTANAKIPHRRMALVKHEVYLKGKPNQFHWILIMREIQEIKMLAEQASKVHVDIDITRYIRDIVVGLRTHPLVRGGLTARASQDLVSVTKYVPRLLAV